MVESFENLEVILPDLLNENIEQSLAGAVDEHEKKEEEEEEEEKSVLRKKPT